MGCLTRAPENSNLQPEGGAVVVGPPTQLSQGKKIFHSVLYLKFWLSTFVWAVVSRRIFLRAPPKETNSWPDPHLHLVCIITMISDLKVHFPQNLNLVLPQGPPSFFLARRWSTPGSQPPSPAVPFRYLRLKTPSLWSDTQDSAARVPRETSANLPLLQLLCKATPSSF